LKRVSDHAGEVSRSSPDIIEAAQAGICQDCGVAVPALVAREVRQSDVMKQRCNAGQRGRWLASTAYSASRARLQALTTIISDSIHSGGSVQPSGGPSSPAL